MVAKVISGKNIHGALNYNEQKVLQGTAHCLQASGFLKEVQDLTFKDKLTQLTDLTEKNKRTKTNTLHVSLNFDPKEKLTDELLNQIVSTYMNKIGFGDQPYLVYSHHDAAHPHVHIVTTNITEHGQRISLHNIGRNQSEKARKEIEKEFGLVRAEGQRKDQKELLRPADIQKATYGKSETKRSISNIVRTVTRSYKYTSLPELNATLKQYNVIADRGREGSMMHAKKGLHYSLLDEKGNKVGVPIKASSIYGKPTLQFLEQQFVLNEALRKPFKEPLKKSIDGAFAEKDLTRSGFIHRLHRQGIFVLFRDNAEGRTYGVTFVDNNTKVVFNGSDLGKQYGAKAILERLSKGRGKVSHFRPGYSEIKPKDIPRHSGEYLETGLLSVIHDLTKAESTAGLPPEAAMNLRKKRKRKRGQSPN